MEPMTVKMRRDNLLTRLRPDVRQKLTGMSTIPEDRDELVAVATRIEGIGSQHTRAYDNDRREPQKDRRRPEEDRRNADRPALPLIRRNTLPHPRTSHMSDGQIICYHCGEIGHISRDCPTSRRKLGKVQAVEAGQDEATIEGPRSPRGSISYGSNIISKRKYDQE